MNKRSNDHVVLVLLDARKLIEREEDWWDGNGAHGRRLCPLLAIDAAASKRRPHDLNGPLKYLYKSTGTPLGIPAWNDTPGRTHAEVLQAFDRAIALRLQELQVVGA